jgi:hypothetical protein
MESAKLRHRLFSALVLSVLASACCEDTADWSLLPHCPDPTYIGAVKKILIGSVLFATVSSLCQKTGPLFTFPPQPKFDTPVAKKLLKLPFPVGSREAQQPFTIDVTCYFYSGFLVKQESRGVEKGTAWISIVPSTDEKACAESRVAGERVLRDKDLRDGNATPDDEGWSGWYFSGAKGSLLFFVGDRPGGMDFRIYDSRSDKPVFSDSAYELVSWAHKIRFAPFDSWRVINAQDGLIILRYLRLENLDCDLHRSTLKVACWEKVKKKVGLQGFKAPICSDYEHIHGYAGSVIAYPVEVALLPQPTTRVIAGPVKCWPQP